MKVDDRLWIVPPGKAIWIPPDRVHTAHSHGRFEGWFVYIARHACAELPDHVCTIWPSTLLRETALRAAQWWNGPSDQATNRIAGVLLAEVGDEAADAYSLPLPRDPRLRRISRALLADPGDERGLEARAAQEAMAARTLSRRFKVETGLTFTEWRRRARLARALELLTSQASVTAIGEELGYSTPSAFISHFRTVFGETPARYRRRRPS